MLRSRFHSLPRAFEQNLIPSSEDRPRRKGFAWFDKHSNFEESQPNNEVFAKFSQLWNEIIESLREEDYLSNHEKELLLIPYSTDSSAYNQWPAFLLANKVIVCSFLKKYFDLILFVVEPYCIPLRMNTDSVGTRYCERLHRCK